jgi:hypothetical protein
VLFEHAVAAECEQWKREEEQVGLGHWGMGGGQLTDSVARLTADGYHVVKPGQKALLKSSAAGWELEGRRIGPHPSPTGSFLQ